MKKRMTMQFKSQKGNEYWYDDATGLILPWDVEDEVILRQLLAGAKIEEILSDQNILRSDKFENKVYYLSYLLNYAV